jgi:Glutaredoxin-like domain (DUF836)
LLTRAYCHLCDEMLAAVRPLADARGTPVDVIDIDTDPTLEQAFGDLVPVLFAGRPESGVELCHYHVDFARLDAALAGAGRAVE